MSLAEELKERARREGAALAGIAPAAPMPQASLLEAQLAADRDASLSFLRRDAAVRQDVRRWYPQAQSVLVCGFAYGGGRESKGPGMGRIARYAACEDYHTALKRRMEAVLAWLRTRAPEADGRAFADSSPVLERLYGAAAGLGWVGKNRLLISERIGSYFLIAGLALNLPLESDRPVPERCGSCRRCLEACPTRALDDGRPFAAGRCIAYLTIEHRGPLPKEHRPRMGGWVAGCDLCQEACPFNSAAPREGVLAPALPQGLPLEELAACDEAGFRERFGRTPVSRLKARGLKRNALLAMGNSGLPRFRPVLERWGQDPDPVLSEQSLWSLARLPR
ncbi:MAG: tRNA epoxyqueuosine(34) reductase QueG [Elusimicrobia bacterium]|nr:tRNA epoxyqueuosine(34) reductase QueG [Elusimicrobiota bacterium]